MKLMVGPSPYGWRMYGLLGKGERWFFGFSRAIPEEWLWDIQTQDDLEILVGRPVK